MNNTNRQYSLEFDLDTADFVLKVRADMASWMLSSINTVPEHVFVVHGTMPEFTKPDDKKEWGYGKCVQEVAGKEEDPYRIFRVSTKSPNCASGALSWLFSILAMHEERRHIYNCPSQGITVENVGIAAASPESYNGASMELSILPEMTRWLQSLTPDKREELTAKVVRTIKACYDRMIGRESSDFFTFRQTEIREDGTFKLWTQGNNCHIETAGTCADPDGSRRAFANNCDTTIQQASLLAGIAVLWEAFIRACEAE